MPDPMDGLVQGAPVQPDQTGFESLEWLVIAIGARDVSIPLHGTPIGQALLRLFGVDRSPSPLASPRLEMLRRMASLARVHGWGIPACEVGLFLRAGWTDAQLERLIESVTPQHPSNDLTGAIGQQRPTIEIAAPYGLPRRGCNTRSGTSETIKPQRMRTESAAQPSMVG